MLYSEPTENPPLPEQLAGGLLCIELSCASILAPFAACVKTCDGAAQAAMVPNLLR